MFIGTYGGNRKHNFTSRPSAVKFWYKYAPEGNDTWQALVQIMNGSTVIGEGRLTNSAHHGDALTAAFPKIDTEIIDRLMSINQRYLDTRGAMTFHDIYSIDMEFHRVFFETADNMYMDKFKEELDIHALRIENRFFKSGANRQKSYEGHQRIIECLTKKDLQGAVEAMKENFMYTVREIADSGSHLPVQGAGERAAAQV